MRREGNGRTKSTEEKFVVNFFLSCSPQNWLWRPLLADCDFNYNSRRLSSNEKWSELDIIKLKSSITRPVTQNSHQVSFFIFFISHRRCCWCDEFSLFVFFISSSHSLQDSIWCQDKRQLWSQKFLRVVSLSLDHPGKSIGFYYFSHASLIYRRSPFPECSSRIQLRFLHP